MLKDLQFLYDVYKDIKGSSKQKEFLRNIIRSEAKLNNDIANVISRTGPKIVAMKMPELYEQLDTNSFDLLSALGVTPHEVFDESETQLLKK